MARWIPIFIIEFTDQLMEDCRLNSLILIHSQVKSAEGLAGGFNKIKSSVEIIFADMNILIICAIQCLFESSMYIFVFLWSPVLERTSAAGHGSLPYGLIFSTFMVSIMIGSLLFQKFIDMGFSRKHVAFMTLMLAMISLLIPSFSRVEFLFVLSAIHVIAHPLTFQSSL